MSDTEKKNFTTADYNKFTSNLIHAKITQELFANNSDNCYLIILT